MAQPVLNSVSNLFLCGFMGAGKSTIGPELALRLGWDFIDTDREIERACGMTIPEAFAALGEPEFRKLEREAVGRCALGASRVVALGGGALEDPESQRLVQETGRLIYLRARPETLISRLRVEDRPLLREHTGEALRARIEDLLAAREPTYRRAHLLVDTDGLDVEAVLARLLQLLGGEDA